MKRFAAVLAVFFLLAATQPAEAGPLRRVGSFVKKIRPAGVVKVIGGAVKRGVRRACGC